LNFRQFSLDHAARISRGVSVLVPSDAVAAAREILDDVASE